VSTRRKLFWISVLYFAEGMPMGIVVDKLPVYLRAHGVSLEAIGVFASLTAPWTLKPLWAPLVDRFGERRHWIVAALLVMALATFAIPFGDPTSPSTLLILAVLALTIAGATQDIAIDAYTIGLLEPGEEGVGNGVRVSAYRAALIASGGGLLLLASRAGWTIAFDVAALIFVGLAVAAWVAPPVAVVRQPVAAWARAFVDWLSRPGAVAVLLFIVLYKLADVSMGPMVKPFWLDSGLTLEDVALVSTTAGVGLTIAGALAGGWFTSRFGIFHGLWFLGLLQAFSNLGYAGAAALGGGRAAIYAASMLESFTGGLGTAAFLAFLMHVCEREQAATQYALLSALFGLTRSVSAPFTGYGVTHFGYATYFAMTFALAFPAYALLPSIRSWIHDRDRPAGASAAPHQGE
jgi:MFS transporter, PAT family, beta-lactamase induction signal transducer AmpG